MNCGPLSETIAAGNPHLLKILVNCDMITLAVAVRMGIASGHLVARSMFVKRNLKTPVAVGNGPTKSIATLSEVALLFAFYTALD